MRTCRLVLAVLLVVAPGSAWPRHAGAGGGGEAAACELSHHSGTPVSITFITRDVFVSDTSVQVINVTVTAEHGGRTYGPFQILGGTVQALSTMDAACGVFNDLGLSAQILAGIGKKGTALNFTRCSFLGPSLTSPDNNGCKGKEGNIHNPPGWTANVVTGYIDK